MGFPAIACDVCGSSAGNQYMGILPQLGGNFVGLQYQYRSFQSSFPPLFATSKTETSQESYNTMQVWGRYQPAKNIQLFGFVPYQYNVRTSDTGTYSINGVGDASVLANIRILNKDDEEREWKHYLQGGAGLKMPTGRYTSITDLDRAGIPNLQPGSGSWDILTNVNYTVSHNELGLNLDGSFTITTPNKYDLKYGNRLNSALTGFYRLEQNEFVLLPQLSIRYEYAMHDYTNYSKKWLNTQSGGYICYAAAGVQVAYKAIGLRLIYSLPVAQHFADDYVRAKHRLETGLLIFLKN